MAELDLNELKRRMDGAISSLKSDLAGLRTGRASPSLLDPITVEAYGNQMPLNQVANVTAPEARMVAVTVWDKQMVGKVERAIRESSLGLNPITDGQTLRIPLPELNEQRRKELVKVAQQYGEGAKIAARHVRRDGMETLKKLEKDGEMGQDDSRQTSDRVQKLTDDTIAEIEKMLSVKEAEIMQV
ncbi:MAG: ribosome recycling factor [Aurantimonas endophytica]|jgi:ribosome recycling factor|uniref:Ribosome-recycling factor n=1 Tax=Aurantimonas endophytica TaxID=1522175 RepID=A0A7W6MN40_9HYPH|nr:ribosome recycling factor [Aurantimonas endophytica]MBB4001473.1 ribosome recycling factor [Aurantimonas endophytica]MCO6402886.1 ribosome recycling factor [Aurantimonas endophytica]